MIRPVIAAAIASTLGLAVASPCAAQDASVSASRRARIETACVQVRRADWEHIALGGTMGVLGAIEYVPSLLDGASARPAFTALGTGMGLGLFGGGLILALRPVSPAAMRLVMTCEQLAGRHRGDPSTLRNAERYFTIVADGERDWALRAGLVAGGITVLGVVLSALVFPTEHDRFFWSGVFLTAPLALWFDLLVPSPPVQAALRFRHGGFALGRLSPGVFTTSTNGGSANGGGFVLGGSF